MSPINHTLDETYWTAVQERDPAYDGSFVFAVKTTGIYCRPSCPSRRPKRENVTFYAAPGDAAAAGYRACRRCEPNAVETSAERAVVRARTYLEARVTEPVTLAELARDAGVSPHHLQRIFKRQMGVSPAQYAAALRAEGLKELLRSGTTVSRATFEAGYGASSRVYDGAARQLGMTPATYRRGGKGVRIRFVTAESPLGRLLVAATDRGVCSVMLGDDDASLERALGDEFPNADRSRADTSAPGNADLAEWIASVSSHLAGDDADRPVQLDIAGTPFQRRVWSALRQIPYGETRSYSELAETIGMPRAVRAVASACARNPVALVIPCHRVVQAGGKSGQYRWGAVRKARLLAQEHAVAVRRVER